MNSGARAGFVRGVFDFAFAGNLNRVNLHETTHNLSTFMSDKQERRGQTGRFLVSLDTTTRLTAKSVSAYNLVLRYGKVRKLWRGSKKPRMKGR